MLPRWHSKAPQNLHAGNVTYNRVGDMILVSTMCVCIISRCSNGQGSDRQIYHARSIATATGGRLHRIPPLLQGEALGVGEVGTSGLSQSSLP